MEMWTFEVINNKYFIINNFYQRYISYKRGIVNLTRKSTVAVAWNRIGPELGAYYFKNDDNKFLTSNPNGDIYLDENADDWAKWHILQKVNITAPNSLFLCGEKKETAIANRSKAKHWEIWLIENLGEDKMCLKSFWGKYLSYENGEKAPLLKKRCNGSIWNIESAEQFEDHRPIRKLLFI